MRPRQNHDDGFTLLEVLVSLAILSIGIVLVIQLFSAGLSSARNSEDYTRAVIYARQKAVEALQVTPLTEGRRHGVSGDGLNWTVEVTPMEALESNSTIRILKVITSVQDSKGKNMITFQTLKTVLE